MWGGWEGAGGGCPRVRIHDAEHVSHEEWGPGGLGLLGWKGSPVDTGQSERDL